MLLFNLQSPASVTGSPHFNTSNVTIQQDDDTVEQDLGKFQYI